MAIVHRAELKPSKLELLAQWLPFGLFAILCFWFYHVLAHIPGGQPISRVERTFSQLGKLIGRIIKPRVLRDAAQKAE